jgi:hypothetical protein
MERSSTSCNTTDIQRRSSTGVTRRTWLLSLRTGASPLAEARDAEPARCVRVFILDEIWRIEVPQFLYATRPFPHFSIAEFIAIDNERMLPQQSVSAITNVDDIESHLDEIAKNRQRKPYLTAIDLPLSQRSTVFADLAHMGVTAGSLFPGLDGTCEELKERHFR